MAVIDKLVLNGTTYDISDSKLSTALDESALQALAIEFCRLRAWSNESGFIPMSNRLSCITTLNSPVDTYLDVNHVTDIMTSCIIYIFDSYAVNPSPSSLIDTIVYSIGINGNRIIRIPANTYWCFSLSQENNVDFESTDPAQNIRISFNPFIDETLNVYNSAANSKTVGEAFDALDADKITEIVKTHMEIKGWNDTYGFVNPSGSLANSRLSCTTPIYTRFPLFIDLHDIEDIYILRLLKFTGPTATPSTYKGSSYDIDIDVSESKIASLPANEYYCFQLSKFNNETFANGDRNKPILSYTPFIDKTLTLDGAAAESSIVGEKINGIYDAIDSRLPNYYYENDYFPNKLMEVQNAMNFANGVCFGFITDTHFTANSGFSKNMLVQILNKTGVPFVIFGGDLAPGPSTQEMLQSTIDKYQEYVAAIGFDRWYPVHGNHDIYCRDETSASVYYKKTLQEVYNMMMRKHEVYIQSMESYHLTYCIDIPAHSTRMIILNSTDMIIPDGGMAYTKWQIKWLAAKLQELSNQNIIIVSHLSPDSVIAGVEASDTEVVRNMLSAYQNRSSITYDGVLYDFSSASNTIIFQLAGHTHYDISHFENNIFSIATTCDAYYQDDGEHAAPGTITEQAFDIYLVNYGDHTVKTIRFGRGSNRAYDYTTGNAVV